MTLFTPVGAARELAVDTPRRAVAAAAVGDTAAAAAALDRTQPESPDASAPTVAGCVGVALGLLDDWLSGHDPRTPSSLAVSTRLPAGHWVGKRAAVDVRAVALPSAERLRSLDTLTARHVGQHVLYGSAFALTATLHAWAQAAGPRSPGTPGRSARAPRACCWTTTWRSWPARRGRCRGCPRPRGPTLGSARSGRPGWVVRRGAGRGGR